MFKKIIINKLKQFKSHNHFNEGFTLIEVLTALAIMGFTIVFIGGVYIALNATSVNTENIKAEELAKSQMESIMRESYIPVSEYDPENPEKRYSKIDIPQELVDAGYEINIMVINLPGSPENIQKVIVEVNINKDGNVKPLMTLIDYKRNNA